LTSRHLWRAAIIAGSLLIGAAVSQSSLSNALRETRPNRAVQIAPGNARAAIAGALSLLDGGASPTDYAVQTQVRAVLKRDPTIPAAVELAALDRGERGDRAGEQHLYDLSTQLSRRSLATRLWLIQAAVERGDAAGALANMELALRTSSAAPNVVFPALARGLEDPNLVAPIAAMVDRPSEWRSDFIGYAMRNADPIAAARLLATIRHRRDIDAGDFDRLLVRLVDGRQYSVARMLGAAFGRVRSGSGPIADPTFLDEAARYPFGWAITGGEAFGARRDRERGQPVLTYHANSAEGGQIAAQVLALRPGKYRLATRVARADAAQLQPWWLVSCTGRTTPLILLPVSSTDQGVTSGRFSIPRDCQTQWLVLVVRPALQQQAGSIAEVRLLSDAMD
jgi:hypothetical protein